MNHRLLKALTLISIGMVATPLLHCGIDPFDPISQPGQKEDSGEPRVDSGPQDTGSDFEDSGADTGTSDGSIPEDSGDLGDGAAFDSNPGCDNG